MAQIYASVYTDLLDELTACRTDEQMIDLLYKKQRIVDGQLLRFFTDPHFIPYTVSVIKGGKKMESMQKWVQQQFTLNVVTQ